MDPYDRKSAIHLKSKSYEKKKFYQGNMSEKLLDSVKHASLSFATQVTSNKFHVTNACINKYSKLEALIGRLSNGTISGTNLPEQKRMTASTCKIHK